MIKIINRSNVARDKLLQGIKEVSDTVGITLGPKGRNVIIEKKFVSPKITKDGVSVAKEIEIKDKVKNLGARVIREAANRTNDKAGDGTTTTIVLAECMAREGVKAITAGINPMDLKRGMDLASEKILKEIEKSSRQISVMEEIEQVATISANGDKDIGKKIAIAFSKVGRDGVITVEEANRNDTFEVDIVKGMNFNRGYISPYFVTNSEKMICELNNPYVVIIDKKISSVQQMVKLLEQIAQSSKQLLIIAEDVEGEALTTLIVNKIRGGLKIAAVKAPGFGDIRKEMMEDISVLTGSKIINEDLGDKIDDINIEELGRAKKVIIKKDETTIVQENDINNEKKLDKRCRMIKYQIMKNSIGYEKQKLKERLAKLKGGIAVLKVGGLTEVEVKEKKDRVEDAYNATKAAISEGIVPGGGSALLFASKILNNEKGNNSDETVGIEIIKKSLSAPIKKILNNAGLESPLIIERLIEQKNSEMTFDAQKNKIVNAFKSGIIDPTKVVRNALQSASSIASLLITTEATIVEDKRKNNNDDFDYQEEK